MTLTVVGLERVESVEASQNQAENTSGRPSPASSLIADITDVVIDQENSHDDEQNGSDDVQHHFQKSSLGIGAEKSGD